MRLDKNKPYGQIFGETADGACFKQNGVRFDGAGVPVGKAPKDKIPAPVVVPIAPEVTPPAAPEDYENMHHMVIKKLVREAGGEVSDPFDREAAIAFLKGGAE